MAASLQWYPFKTVYLPGWRPEQMRLFDTIIMGITIGVARLLRGLLRVYNALVSPFREEPVLPFGKCDKVARLRNNRTDVRLSDLRVHLPTTSEDAPRRQIVQ